MYLPEMECVFTKKEKFWVPVAHACNPSYWEGRDEEDHSSRPAQANSSQDPISQIPNTKKELVEWLNW
jgi:hypothetical protein